MERIGIQLHSRPMAGAALGAVMASVLALLVPDWLLLALCAALIPVSVFLFKRRSAFFLLPAVLFFVLVRAVLLPAQMPPIRFVTTLREQLCLNADALFSDRAAEARGILLGDRSMMDSALTAQYAQSGLLHMFAVSGLHVTLLVGAFSRVVRSSVRWLTLAAEALFCVFLCAVTGFSASVLRAVFMLLGVQLCRLRDRQVDRASVLCFAMVCTLLLDPYSVSTAGFQMSFAATGGMVLLAKAFRKPFKRFGNSAIVRALTSAAAASLGLLPLQAYYFGSVAWVSIPLSILLIPTMPIILVCGFFAVFLYGFAPHIAKVLSLPAYGAMEFLTQVTARLDVPVLRLPRPHPFAIALYFAALLLCSPLNFANRRRVPWIGFAVLIASIVLWFAI